MRKTAGLATCLLILTACGSGTEPVEPATDGQSETSTTDSTSPTATDSEQSDPPPEDPPETTGDSDAPVEADPLTLLLVGADNDTGSQRADVIMLVRIDEEREHASTMSIHRDTWVNIPGHGQNKINASFAYGGEELLAETVNGLYSADIDHTVVIDFHAFQELSTILGPITVDTAGGPVTLEGDEALSFVRERYSLPGGDFDRVRRQQAYLAAAAASVRDASPGELLDLAHMAGEYVSVDGKGGLAVHALILDIVGQTADIDAVFFSAPHAGTGSSDDGQSIVIADDEAILSLAAAYENDEIDDWLADNAPVTLDSQPVN